MSRQAVIDRMIAFALEELASGSDARRRGLVRHICLRWPEAPALSVVFAMTSAAATLEDTLRRDAESACGRGQSHATGERATGMKRTLLEVFCGLAALVFDHLR